MDRQPGAFDKGQSVATASTSFFSLFAYFTPIIGAVIADQFWGKYKTIIRFSCVYLVGWLLVMASVIPHKYAEDGTPLFGSYAYPLFMAAITVVALGTGGIKSVVSPMCADQIRQDAYMVEKKGKQYMVDPDLTVQHLYNWFYWAINLGSVFGTLICTQLEKKAFWQAYMLPVILLAISTLIIVAGNKRYVKTPPEGSVILSAWRCIRYASARQKQYKDAVPIPAEVKNFKFLEYAKAVPGETQQEVAQRTWASTFPQELRQTFKACSIFPLMIIYWTCYNQMNNNLISQASQLKRPSWLTNDAMNVVDPIFLVVMIPVFDNFVYPFLSRRKIVFGYMARITIGFFLGALSMFAAAWVQQSVYNDAKYMAQLAAGVDAADAVSDVSIYLQLPAFFLIAASEIFASIASMEYSYTHAPVSMKCLISALALLPNAGASLLGLLLAPLSHDPNMAIVYGGIGGVALISTVVYYFMFRSFDKEDEALAKDRLAAEASNDGLGNVERRDPVVKSDV
ncbi:POT family-domain-containing protein [Phlyctochytrium arcticum]|nr:POT family-domain-containing protein [Phlyctochytrium arcticum]